MKPFRILAALAALLLSGTSCQDFLSLPREKTGTLSWTFPALTRAADFPDTNRFLLTVTDAGGNTLYDGLYGDSPERMEVAAGSYTLSVRSGEFKEPAFDTPIYGDTQVVQVLAGKTTLAILSCTMLGSGIRLKISPEFIAEHPSGTLELSSIDGRLSYGFQETRTAYFRSGIVSLLLKEGENVRALFSRDLEPREVLTVSLGGSFVSGSTGAEISVQVDTAKVWHEADATPGSGSAGTSKENALSIPQAKASAGATGVWVYGYIVGGDLSSSGNKMNTGPTFEKDTHLAIAARSSVTEKSACLSVELKKADIRSAINLKDHPELLGHILFLKGDIVSGYYGIPGVKNVSEISFE